MEQGQLSHATGRHNAGEATILGDSTVGMASLMNAVNKKKAERAVATKARQDRHAKLDDIIYKSWSKDIPPIMEKKDAYLDFVAGALDNKDRTMSAEAQVEAAKMRQGILNDAYTSVEDRKWYNTLNGRLLKDEKGSILDGEEVISQYADTPLGQRTRGGFKYKVEDFDINPTDWDYSQKTTGDEGVINKSQWVQSKNLQIEKAFEPYATNIESHLREGTGKKDLPTKYSDSDNPIQAWKQDDPEGFYAWGENHLKNVELSNTRNTTPKPIKGSSMFGGDNDVPTFGGDNAVNYNTEKRNADGEVTNTGTIYSNYNMPMGKSVSISVPAGEGINLTTGSRGDKRTGTVSMKVNSVGSFPTVMKDSAKEIRKEFFDANTSNSKKYADLAMSLSLLESGEQSALSAKNYSDLETILGDRFDDFVENKLFLVGSSSDTKSQGDDSKTVKGDYAIPLNANNEEAFRAVLKEKGYSKESIDKKLSQLKAKASEKRSKTDVKNNTAAPKESEIVSEDEFFKP